MKISITEAGAVLSDLVRRAQAGEEVILTRNGRPTVRLVAIDQPEDRNERRRVLEAATGQASLKAIEGASAARSQDFLYDEDGLPR